MGRPRPGLVPKPSMICHELDNEDEETAVVSNGILFIPNFMKGGTKRHQYNLIIKIRQSTSLTQ
jgi:hypothetical protein